MPPYIHEALVKAYIGNASHRGLRDDDLAALAAPWLDDEGLEASITRSPRTTRATSPRTRACSTTSTSR